MAYTPGSWTDGITVISKADMDRIEGKIASLDAGGAGSLRDHYLRPSIATYETVSRAQQLNTNFATVTGNLYLCAIALPAGLVINNISHFSSSVAAVTPTHWWFGLYDSGRVQLALTADQLTGAWAANTAKTLPIASTATGAASSFTTTYEGLYYLGFMMTAATMVNLVSLAMLGAAAALTPLMLGVSDTSQTTPPAFPRTATAIGSTVNQAVYATVG